MPADAQALVWLLDNEAQNADPVPKGDSFAHYCIRIEKHSGSMVMICARTRVKAVRNEARALKQKSTKSCGVRTGRWYAHLKS